MSPKASPDVRNRSDVLHPTEPAPAATSSAPDPSDPIQSLAAHLDDVMEQSAIAANAQRDEEAGTPAEPPVRQEAPNTTAAGEDEDEDDDDTEEDEVAASEPAATAPEVAEPAPSDTPTEPPKYSRRDAARFAAEAETHKRDAAEARQIAARAQAEVNAMHGSDLEIMTALGEISGYTRDSSGRFKYEVLRDKVVEGTATDEERQEVAEMTQWHKLAGPIYRQAESQVTRTISADWSKLKDLEGVGDKGLEKLNQAASPTEGVRQVHAMAYAAGAAKAKAEADQTIATLRAQLKSAKIGAVAGAPQPAVANGAAVPAGGSFLDRAIDPKTGLPNEDFDREVRAGKWLGVDLSQTN